MVDTNRIQVTRMGGGGIPDRWAGELESVVRRPDGALRVTMRTIGEGVVTVIDFDADDVGWIVAAAQPEPPRSQKVLDALLDEHVALLAKVADLTEMLKSEGYNVDSILKGGE